MNSSPTDICITFLLPPPYHSLINDKDSTTIGTHWADSIATLADQSRETMDEWHRN